MKAYECFKPKSLLTRIRFQDHRWFFNKSQVKNGSTTP